MQTLGVHALADMQTWYERKKTWYEHAVASICVDEVVLTVAQRPRGNRNRKRNRQLSVIVNM